MKESKVKKYEEIIGEEATSMLQNTSCLAIGNIFIRNHPLLKSLWCIAFILCTVLTIRQIYNLTVSYFSYPLSTVTKLQALPVDFPSITFCNLNPLRLSKIPLGTPQLKNFIHELEYRNFTPDNANEMDTKLLDEKVFNKIILKEPKEKRFEMGHQLNDFILQCYFLGEKCILNKTFTRILSNKYGNCYIFNPYNLYNKSSIIDKRSRNDGLFLTFYLQNEEYLPNFISSNGIRIHFHEKDSLEMPEDYGMNLPPGFQISLGIVPTRILRVEEVKDNCENGLMFFNRYHSRYTRESCMYVCLQERIFQSCGCYDMTFEVFLAETKNKICNSDKEVNCLLNVSAKFNDQNCKCINPCNVTVYDVRQSFAEWPAKSYERRFFADLSDIYEKFNSTYLNDKTQARKNLTNVVIYFENPSVREILQIRAYNWDNYLSDIGGTLSLYLGFSVLTGFEFLEALTLISAYVCGSLLYKRSSSQPET